MIEAIDRALEAMARLVERAIQAAAVKRRERSAIEALSGLDDHALKDIGVHRSQIHHVARHFAENPGVDYRSHRQ
jgi:uncharacterized protein YjiS (DUF1127 family)